MKRSSVVGRLWLSLLVVALTTTCLVVFAMPAAAIQFGTPESGHQYVCLVQVSDTWRGTGFQISPTVVVTAGHILDGFDTANIYFSDTPTMGSPDMVSTRLYTMPGYSPAGGYHDVGIVVLPKAHSLDQYAVLPTEGLVDTLPAMQALDLVGYGANYQAPGGGVGPSGTWQWLNRRFLAGSRLIKSQGVQNTFGGQVMAFTGNPGRGDGALGFGDSGGPVLLRDSNTVLGLMAYTYNYNCMGVNLGQRIDLGDVLDWLNGGYPH